MMRASENILDAELLKVEKRSQQIAGWLLSVTIVSMNVIVNLQTRQPVADFLLFALFLSIALVIWFTGSALLIRKGYYHRHFKYVNLVVQVSTVTFFMLMAARFIDVDFALSSTAPLLYLLVIGLTSLSLNPLLSLLAGGFAAGQFIGAYALWLHQGTAQVAFINGPNVWAEILLRAFIFIMMGVGAMFIARLSRDLLERVVGQVAYEEQIRYIEQEMSQAAEIQEKLIPTGKIEPKYYKVEAFYSPARQVGGDYYDLIERPDGSCITVIGDVSGKGYSAALMMANIQAMTRSMVAQGSDLLQIISALNHSVYNNSVRGKFISLICMEMDPGRQEIRYINCGHNPPIILDRQAPQVMLEEAGPVLGVVENYPYSVEQASFSREQLLLAYTDGLTEMKDRQGRRLGIEKLMDVLHSVDTLEPVIVKQCILAAVYDHLQDAELTDDLSFLCVQRK